jgi:hypothetical protein
MELTLQTEKHHTSALHDGRDRLSRPVDKQRQVIAPTRAFIPYEVVVADLSSFSPLRQPITTQVQHDPRYVGVYHGETHMSVLLDRRM